VRLDGAALDFGARQRDGHHVRCNVDVARSP
jgi:hypothetical protein